MSLTPQIYKDIMLLQDTCNARASNNLNWTQLGNNWGRAIRQEGAEAIDSTPWKWWKAGSIDMDNIKVELVDIFHFVVSIYVEGKLTTADLKLHLEDGFAQWTQPGLAVEDHEFLDEIIEKIQFHSFRSTPFCIERMTNALGLAWAMTGESLESLYVSYMGKNVLNIFRYDNGYRAGTYKKEWKWEGKKQEDNVVCFTILDRLKEEGTPLQSLSMKLRSELATAYEPTRKAAAAAQKRKAK